MQLSKFKYYKSLDTLPIWNWYKVHKTNDLKYMLIIDNYDEVVKLSSHKVKLLQTVYQDLLYSFETINAPLLEQKKKIVLRIIDLIIEIMSTGLDIGKVEKAGTILSAMLIMNDPNIDWLYKVDFTDSSKQKDFITKLAIEIKKYDEQKSQQKTFKEQSLYEKTSKIMSILGVTIDIKTCPVILYQAHEAEAREKVTQSLRSYGRR